MFAGDIYFLRYYISGNAPGNWRIVIKEQVELAGAIYNDNTSVLPFIVQSGGGAISTTSSLTYAYTGVGASVPTAAQVRDAVWSTTPATYSAGTMAKIVNNTNNIVANIETTTQNIFAVSV